MPIDLIVDNDSDEEPPGPPDPVPPVTPPVHGTHQWVILARDANFTPQAAIEDYPTFTFVSRWNAVGTFVLPVPLDSLAIPALLANRAGIIVLCDGQVVFSGPIRNRLRTNSSGVDQLVVSGVDDNFWLQARLAHPEPDQDAPDGSDHYAPNVYDTRTGICSTVLTEYVDVNLGPSAIPRRQVPTLTLNTDMVLGSTIEGNGRWQPLLELLQRKAIESDPTVTFQIRQNGTALEWSTSLPNDRTATVVFQAETGTLGDFDIERAGGEANFVFAAGAGAEADRLIAEAENGEDAIRWGLIEEFLDRRDIGGIATLRQAAVAEVAQQAGIFRTDLQVIDTAGLAWLTDYDLGDRVSVIVDGVRLTELVREVKVELGPGDLEKITPSVSSPSRKASVRQQAMFAELRDLRARVSNLERN